MPHYLFGTLKSHKAFGQKPNTPQTINAHKTCIPQCNY